MKSLFVGKGLILTPKRRNRHNLERAKISTEEVSQGTVLGPPPTLLNFNSPSGSQINACYYHLYYETLSPLTIITPFHLPWGCFLWSRVVCGFSRCGDSPAGISAILSSVFLNTFLLPSPALFSLLAETHPGWKGYIWTRFNFLDTNICDKTAWPFKKING